MNEASKILNRFRNTVQAVTLPLLAFSFLVTLMPRGGTAADDASQGSQLVLENDITPILFAYCLSCHGSEDRKADLDLRTLPLMLRGGKSGPAIVIGSAEKSLLFQKLESNQMPPGDGLRPTDAHLETIRRWIDSGAKAYYRGGPIDEEADPPLTDEDRSWWSFRPAQRPPVPRVRSADRVRSSVDAFVLARLEEHDLTFNIDADPITLVRRVYLDLTGLPPSPEQMDRYLADPAPDRYQRLVDRLLASPEYGARWARHWLDAAGYVDVHGGDNDHGIIKLLDGIWRYRDYVIDAFNDDLPYDRFLTEQIAGDELVEWRNAEEYDDAIHRLLIATGFLRLAADKTGEGVGDLDNGPIRHQVVNETLVNFGTNVLGLTLHCAQCHSHKYDPISHRDYYRLRALIAPAFNRQNWINSKERQLHMIPEARFKQINARNVEIDAEIKQLEQQVDDIRSQIGQRIRTEKLPQIPAPVRADTDQALTTPDDKRTAVQKYLAQKLGPLLNVTDAEIDQAQDDPARPDLDTTNARIADLKAERHEPDKIQALWDVGPPPTQYILRRGNFQTPGAVVLPGVISVLDARDSPFQLPDAQPDQPTSGYRTALAAWLTRPDHPLTARVFVNRVWQHYFDRGIVETVDNFGRSGAVPSHPRLLDWLATEFVQSGWQIKNLHRLIVNSTVYRQASRWTPDGRIGFQSVPDESQTLSTNQNDPLEVDSENRLLWRMPLRRLDSEVIRDSILAVSGKLDRTCGGPPVPVKAVDGGIVEIDTEKMPTPTSAFRRTIYVVSRRNYHMAELRVFDQPSVATNCTQRTKSAVVLQSLTLLNGRFTQQHSEYFAERVKQPAGEDEQQRIETAFRLALSRGPTTEEFALGKTLIARQTTLYREADQALTSPAAANLALRDLCQMLLNSSRFLYVE